MDIRNVSVDDFLVWPDDRPTDGDMIRDFIAAGRSRDEWLFIGYVDGVPTLRIGYRTSPFMNDPTRSGSLPATRLFAIGREGTDRSELFREFIQQTVPRDLPDDVDTLETRLNESKHADAEVRARELEAIGFHLLMAKVVYIWNGRTLPDPRAEMTFRSAEQIGRAAYTEVIARAGAGGLDREMVYYQNHTDINHWAEEHVRYLGDRDDLFSVAYMADEQVGLVALDNPDESAYISYVAVIPEHRGKGYANDLVRYGTNLALEAGWSRPIRAQTDLVNVPMRTAFTSHGYEEEPRTRTWGHFLNFKPAHMD